VSAIGVILFLGGWWTGIAPLDSAFVDLGYLGRVLGMGVLLVKASALVFMQIWIRWTLPRLRIDQVMTTCLKYLVPIACFLFLGATVWSLMLPGTTFCGMDSGLGTRTVDVGRIANPSVTEVSPAVGSDGLEIRPTVVVTEYTGGPH
jgi:NADH-quinone oxidoreductase subunit H